MPQIEQGLRLFLRMEKRFDSQHEHGFQKH